MKAWRLALISAALAAGAAGALWCASGERAKPRPLGPPCDREAERPAIGRVLSVSLFLGAGVGEADVRERLERARDYFTDYDLELRVGDEAVRLSRHHMLGGDEEASRGDAGEDGADPLAPLRAFIAEHAGERDGSIRVVALPAIAPPDSPVAEALPDLRGLTISPAMGPDAGFGLGEGLGGEHAAVILIRVGGDPRADARALVHEIGHALGLEHRHAPGNLMLQREHACAPWIDRAQARAMKGALRP